LNTKLTIEDIADLRAYEREREDFRQQIIVLKKRRRVPVGPFVTLLFENRDTIRFQVQEMARVEKIISDEGIQTELDIYNPLIPEPGTLAATMFIELTNKDELLEWLPKLVGVERAVQLRIGPGAVTPQVGAGPPPEVVRARVDAEHEKQLTRETITASVHYVHFDLTPDQIEHFARGPVRVEIDHPAYAYGTNLDEVTTAELLTDLKG
jgi:hypothetical protein